MMFIRDIIFLLIHLSILNNYANGKTIPESSESVESSESNLGKFDCRSDKTEALGAKVTYGEKCSQFCQCENKDGLTCIAYLCLCTPGFYWNGNSCVEQKPYTSSCSASNECLSQKNLYCSTTGDLCNCPTQLGSGKCDCQDTQYYDNNQGCVARKTHGESCESDYMCVKNVGLSCAGSTCQCPSGPGWFWSPDYLKCIKCPDGWTVYSGRCYYTSTTSDNTWDDGQSYCSSFGGYLMIVNNDAEYSLLLDFYAASGAGRLWIGGKTNDFPKNWFWVDGSRLSSTSPWWCQGEPNNAPDYDTTKIYEPCLEMWKDGGGFVCFNDFACENKKAFVCEYSA